MEEKMFQDSENKIPRALKGDGTYIRVYPIRGAGYEIEAWKVEGGHAGGDAVLLDDLFSPNKKPDKFLRASDQKAGAYSCLTGIAANHSFKTGKEIFISDLVKNIGKPEFPSMPSRTDKLQMPEKNSEPKGVD
jgi:hypothetical protein